MPRTLSTAPIDPDNPTGAHDLDGTIATDLEALRQRVGQRLSFGRGTWLFDPAAGTDSVIGHQTTAGLAEAVIRNAIREEGGDEITSVTVTATLDAETRQFRYLAEVGSIYGSFELEGLAV